MLFKAPQGKGKDFGRQVTSLPSCTSYMCVCEEGLIWRFSVTNRVFKLMPDAATRPWHHSWGKKVLVGKHWYACFLSTIMWHMHIEVFSSSSVPSYKDQWGSTVKHECLYWSVLVLIIWRMLIKYICCFFLSSVMLWILLLTRVVCTVSWSSSIVNLLLREQQELVTYFLITYVQNYRFINFWWKDKLSLLFWSNYWLRLKTKGHGIKTLVAAYSLSWGKWLI